MYDYFGLIDLTKAPPRHEWRFSPIEFGAQARHLDQILVEGVTLGKEERLNLHDPL